MANLTATQREELKRLARLELCRRNFWEYCKEMAPDFYNEDREFLKSFCGELQDFYESDDTVMVVNVPPRHGKSRTAQMLVQWIFGNDVTQKVMTGSYNETLATTFARGVRNTIMEKKVKWMTQYAKLFAKAMKKIGRKDYKKLENLFRNRYMDYMCSDEFEEYRKYGTMPIEKVYAAIAHAKICLEAGKQ